MAGTLEWTLLGISLGAVLTNLTGVVSSMLGLTSYYPLGEKDWQFYVFWGVSHASNVTVLALGYLQFGKFGLPGWTRPVGLVLFVGGFVIVIAATFDLGVPETQGAETALQTGGLYRYSRNPQYVGYVPATVGYALIVDAPFVVPVCASWLVWWVVLPFAEEPWLEEELGPEYRQYAESVPRFVGWKTIERLWDDAIPVDRKQ